jgi:anti-sigma B factor antagonist
MVGIEQRMAGDAVVLSVSGDMTLSGTSETPLADAVRDLLQRGCTRIVLDLARVRYVDSAGLGQLVQALAAARTRGGGLKLLNVTRGLADLLVVTNLLFVFECFDLESEALASFDPDARRRWPQS